MHKDAKTAQDIIKSSESDKTNLKWVYQPSTEPQLEDDSYNLFIDGVDSNWSIQVTQWGTFGPRQFSSDTTFVFHPELPTLETAKDFIIEEIEKAKIKAANPVFTGRIGEEHKTVVQKGSNYLIVEFSDGKCENYFKVLADSELQFNNQDLDAMFPKRDWEAYQVVRAYNVEDAINHSGAAHEQWRAWFDGKDNWQEAPFLDKDDNLVIDSTGKLTGESSGDYAVFWPCKDAAAGIQTTEFKTDSGFFETAPGWESAKNNERKLSASEPDM